MIGRKLEVPYAKRVLKQKGCTEDIVTINPPKTALMIPIKAQRRMGIKSWGLVDFLRKAGILIIQEGAKR